MKNSLKPLILDGLNKNHIRIISVILLSLSFVLLYTNPDILFAAEKTPLQKESVITIKNIDGYVQIKKADDTNWKKASKGDVLSTNHKIRTLLESLAELEYSDGTILTLRENSILDIKDISYDKKTGKHKREIKLNLGGMKYKVTPIREKGSEFKIHSSTAIVGVTGTEGFFNTEGEGKPTTNTLLEGSTYNTDENGADGRPLKPGNTWLIDEEAESNKYMSTDEDENENEYHEKDIEIAQRFDAFVVTFNEKKADGYIVDETILERLTQAMMARDYERVKELLDEGELLLADAKKPADPKAQKINEELAFIREELEQKETEGFDLKNIYLLFSQVEVAYEEEKYEVCLDLIKQIKHDLLNVAEGEEGFLDRLNQLMNEISEKANLGFMVEECIELVKKADISYRNGARANAEALLQKAREMLFQAKRTIPQELLDALEAIREETAAKKTEGFDVAEIEELLGLVDTLLLDEKYIEAEQILRKIKELSPLLTKIIPKELAYLLKTFEEKFAKKEASGFDLAGVQDLIRSIYEAKEIGDFEKLNTLLLEASAILKELGPPEGLLNRLKEFRAKLEELKDSALTSTEIENLASQIQAALAKKDLVQVRRLLDKAEELMLSLKDTEPPTLQVSDLEYTETSVLVSGVSSDNVGVDQVSVNGALATLDDTGSFNKELLLTSLLKEVTVSAKDSEGNVSPEIIIAIPEEKLAGISEDDTSVPELNANDIKLSYTERDVLITGKTSPGAIVVTGELNVTADTEGEFSLTISGSSELIENGLTLTSQAANGNTSPEVKVDVEDKWLPELEVSDVKLYDNMPPTLNVEPLSYQNNLITVKGNSIDTANITIEGSALDVGSGVESLSINGQLASLEAEGIFKHTVLLTAELKTINIELLDKAGNKNVFSKPVDLFLYPAFVTAGGREINVDEKGDFSIEITQTADLKEVTVQSRDKLGNVTTPVKLIVADRIIPEINLGDIHYEIDSVKITGQTETDSLVYDTSSILFQDKVSVDASGLFTIEIPRPIDNITGTLVAQDASGNISEGIEVTIEALKDEKPPKLTVANLIFSGNSVIVSGSVEDDTAIESVTVNDEKVDLAQGAFYKELPFSADLVKVIVIATDASGKTATNEQITKDDAPPTVTLEDLSYEKGYCIVKGEAKDNLGLKEVRVNDVPIYIDLPEGGSFEYELAITAGLEKVVATAIDLYGNYQETEPKEIVPPEDRVPPSLTLNELVYGSPKVIVSGIVSDNIGLKSVLINEKPIDFYEDGTFKVELDIKIGPPSVTLSNVIYTEGFAVISGTANLPTQEPSQIKAVAEDLAGNKSMGIKRDVKALDLRKFKVMINDLSVDLKEGSFRKELILEQGMGDVKVQVYDSLGNASEKLNVPMETTPPVLEVNEEIYEEDNIIISGKASDESSGLAEILINNSPVDFDADGIFSETLPVSESTITVVALDRVGNMTSSIPIEVSPPDTSPPLFVLGLNPIPATIGKDLTITVDVLDTKTQQPEMLDGLPLVNAVLSDGGVKPIEMSGSGASFYGVLSTTDLPTGLITLTVEGKDATGNLGNVKDGLDNVLLNTSDATAPSFSISLSPPPPAIVGTEVTVNAIASETLKSLPNGTLALPDGTSFTFVLEGTLSGTSFTSTISIPADTIPGTAKINLTDAVDLADNVQGTPTTFSFEVEPEKVKAALPLRIEFSEITNEQILVRGVTSSQAMVHIDLGDIKADIPSNDNGFFEFIKHVLTEDIDKMRELGTSILLNCHATNYAGLISEKINLNIPLPTAATETMGGENFIIDISPYPIEQGQVASLSISSRRTLREAPNVSIRLSNGRTDIIETTGSGKSFQGIYRSTQATSIGQAIIQIRSGDIFESRPCMISPSSETYESMAGSGFFTIIANPDPLPMGKELDVSITAKRPVKEIPTLDIRLPNGRLERIILSGEEKEFNGKYLCPQDINPGPAELIVNMGKRSESRRPFGIAPPYGRRVQEGDVFTFSNPRPMVTGSSATITVKSRHPLEEIPSAKLQTSDGKLIPIALTGSAPGHVFNAIIDIASDASLGPAAIIVKDEEGNTLSEHSTEITPGFGASDMEAEAFMVPSPATPGQVVTINVNSMGKEIDFRPTGKLIFSDGLITPFNLEGPIPGIQFRTQLTIPLSASLGPVNIMIMDDKGNPIGGGQGYISRTQRSGGTGEVRISVIPPNPMPGDTIDVSIYSDNNLKSIKVILDVPEKGPRDINVEGPIPGNRFKAFVTFPRDARPKGSRIDAIFDRGAGKEIKSFFLEGRSDDEDHRPPELNPFPPMPGKPLVITLHVPFIINFAPSVKVNYINGNEPVNMNGPIPGDRFTGTLANVAMPVTSIDVLGPGGLLLVNLPIEMLGGTNDAPYMEITPLPLIPGMPANLMLEFPGQVFSLPTANIKSETGRIIPITLTGPIPGSMFTGMFSVPHDTPYGSAKLEVYMDNQPIPGGSMPIKIGEDLGPVTGDMLALQVFPGKPEELNIDWHLLPRAEKHRIECVAPGIPKKTFDAGRTNHYFATGLEADTDYQVTVIAFDGRRREITRSEYFIRTISSSYDNQGFPLYVNPAGPRNLQINWDHQPGALRYNLFYMQGTGAPSTQTPYPVGNSTSYYLSSLSSGRYQVQVEAILSTGETMLSEVREEYVSGDVDYGRPPVELTPYPPMAGSPLDIDVMIPMVIPVLPSVKAQYASQGEEAFAMSGSLPGSNFHGFLPSVKDMITAINFYDPMTGGLKYSHSIGGDMYTSIPGVTPHDLWVRISVDPEPSVGTDANISLDFNQEIDFQFAGLRLLVFFVGGGEIEIPISGSGPQMSYQAMLSASQHTETIETISVEGSRGIVPEEYINTVASGGVIGELSITPDPPIIGNSAQIQVSIVDANTYQPRYIDVLPVVSVEFSNGMMNDLIVSGTLPGSEFYAELTPDMFSSPLTLIDLEYNGILIDSKSFSEESGPVTFGPRFYPEPPIIGQSLDMVLDTDPYEPPLYGYPEVKINYAPGVTPTNELMEITGAIPGRHFSGSISQVKGPVDSADFINPMTGNIEHTHYFTSGPTGATSGTIEVAPNDPPVPDTTVNVYYNASGMVYERPTFEIHYTDNSMQSFDAEGPIPGMNFLMSIYLNKQVSRIEAWNLQHTLILASRHFEDGGPGTGTIAINPDPPYPNTTINIVATTDNYQSSLPKVEIYYADYTVEYPTLTGTLPGTSFSTEKYITKYIERIELLDYNQATLAVRYFEQEDSGEGWIHVDTNDPSPNSTVAMQVTWSNQSSVPILKFYYTDSTVETPPIQIEVEAGTFYVTHYITKELERIELWNYSETTKLAEHLFESEVGGGDWTIETSPDNPYAYTTVNITVTTDVQVSVLPTLKLKYTDNTEDFSAVLSGTLPGTVFTASRYITKDLGRVEVFDNYGDMRSYMNYGGDDEGPEFGPQFTPDPPTIGETLYMVLDLDPYEPPIYGYPTVRINYVSGTSPASEDMQVSGTVPGRHFNGYLADVKGLVETAEFIDPMSGAIVHTHYFVEGIMPALKDSYPTLVLSPDPPTVGTSLGFTITATVPVHTPALEIFYEDGSTFEPVISGDDPGTSFTASLSELTKSIDRIDLISGLNDPFPDDPVLTRYVSTSVAALENAEPTFTFSPDPPTWGTSLNFDISTAFPVHKPVIEIVYEDGSTFEPVVYGSSDPGTGFGATLSSVDKTIDKIKLISGPDDPSPGETVLTHYISGGITPLEDAEPDLSISPNPPIIDDYFQVSITTTETVALPLLEIWYMDGSSYEAPLVGADPGMSFSWSISPLAKTIDRIELYSGMDDPYPDELVDTLDIVLGTLAYPANVWLEAGGIATEVFVNWDSVPEADGYFIYYSISSPSFESPDYVQIFESNITREAVTGLTNGYTYYFTVSAYADDGRESGYDTEQSRVIGSGTSGEGSLTLTVPSFDPAVIDFGNVSPGTTSSNETITIQNTGNTTVTIRKEGGFLTNVLNPSYYISSSNVNFTSWYNISASSSESQTISISVPSGLPSGEYLTVGGSKLKLYADANGNSYLDSGESFIEIDLQLTIGAAGLDALEAGVMFDATAPQAVSNTETVHIQNTAGSILTNIQLERHILHKEGDFSKTIPAIGTNFTLNSATAGILGIGETTTSSIYIAVPDYAVGGTYQGIFVVYNDTDYDSTRDDEEPFVSILLQIPVNASGVIDHFLVTHDGSAAKNSAETITITAKDDSEATVTTYEPDGNVTLTPAGVTGTFSPSVLTSTDFTNGVATVEFTPTDTGSATITAYDAYYVATGNSYTGISESLTVTEGGTMHHFAVTHDGAAVVSAGETITITAQDAGDSTVTGYYPTTTVTLSKSGDVTGNFDEDSLTISDFGSGVATVTFTATSTGSTTITALDNNDSYTGTSSTLTVAAGAASTIKNLTAIDRATGGAIDLTWTDSSDTTDHYHIYYDDQSGSHSYGSPQICTGNPDKAFQITSGLLNTTTYYFVVRGSSADCNTEDIGTTEVSATPTSGGSPPPTFGGITAVYATGVSGQVKVEFDPASYTPDEYRSFFSSNPDTVFSDSTSDVFSPPSGLISGLTNDTIYYFAVRAHNTITWDGNTRIMSASPHATVHHITITSNDDASTVGSPVLVKVTAYDAVGDDPADIHTSFQDYVPIQITESTSYGLPRYITSLQDRVTGDIAEVAMTSGEGYFTIDAIEQTQVNITAPAFTSNTQTISFGGVQGSTATQIAISGATVAKTSTGDDGALIWISVLDSSGKLVTDYEGGPFTLTPTDPGGTNPSYEIYNEGRGSLGDTTTDFSFTESNKGEMRFYITNTDPETLPINVTGPFEDDTSIAFKGTLEYVIESAGQYTISAETIGSRIKFTAYSAFGIIPVNGYNGTATLKSGHNESVNNNNSAMIIPSTIQFVNGVAEFYLENSEYETVTFQIEDTTNSITSSEINATFVSADTTYPELIKAEAETPFLIHLYFSEEIDSENALVSSNYTGGNVTSNVNKVCWYQDEVTLHLNTSFTPGATSQSVTVAGVSGNGIKDLSGNYMTSNSTEYFDVPNTDYQGSSYGSGDWLEIQVSPSSNLGIDEQTVHVIVYHKNACGYMTGSNAVNSPNVLSDITIDYASSPYVTGPLSNSMSNGVSEFDITVDFTSAVSQSFTIEVDNDYASSGIATITVD
ncbi:FecR domain-containing protein [Candidatus Omnitrophota bacterium]